MKIDKDFGQNKKDKRKDAAEPAVHNTASLRRRRRIGDAPYGEKTSMTWLISFTDVMALMLTFFVLLFSMAEPAKQDWSNITSALQSEFNRFYGARLNRGAEEDVQLSRINFREALNIPYLSVLLKTAMAENELLAGARLIRQDDSLIISLPEDLLFESGSAALKSTGTRALYALGGTLSRIRNAVEINGHADPRNIRDKTREGHENNWELSLARAANVAAALENVGYERAIAIHGYSSGRYEDLQEIVEDAEEREALARRVDIVLMNHSGRR